MGAQPAATMSISKTSKLLQYINYRAHMPGAAACWIFPALHLMLRWNDKISEYAAALNARCGARQACV